MTGKLTIIHKEVEIFAKHLDALSTSLPLVMAIAEVTRNEAHDNFTKFIEERGELIEEGDDGKKYGLPPELNRIASRKKKRFETTNASIELLPRSFIVSFVSEYDAYLGRLLRAFYSLKPELLNDSDRQLTYAQLTEFESIEAAREHVLEKEIETLLRKSHAEQFTWLESKFGLPLTKGLDVWPSFIELTERRNLFVHNEGVISSQYLKQCNSNGVVLPDPLVIGDKLGVNKKYVKQSYECLYEIGIKLAHVLWRKLFPEDIKAADVSLSFLTYELLVSERWSLARKLLDFALNTLKRHYNETTKRIFIINHAIATKYGGNIEEAMDSLAKHDWSSCSNDFKLAVAVLRENYVEAKEIMITIGNTGDVTDQDYHDWPLFKDFRQTLEFQTAYVEVFGVEYRSIEELDESDKKDRGNSKRCAPWRAKRWRVVPVSD